MELRLETIGSGNTMRDTENHARLRGGKKMQTNAPKDPKKPEERIKINTGSGSYSFTNAWTENEALRDILSGLVAEDLNRNLGRDEQL